MSNGEAKPIRISPGEAKELNDEGNAVFLDVVDTDVHQKLPVSISGSVRIDPEKVAEEYSTLPKDKTVLVFCT